jgi:abequosyltransferase
MDSYLFSICIPTWNRSNLLEGLLRTISTDIESDSDFQVVIGDNNSDPSSYKAAESFFDKLNIKYIRRDRNIGFGQNLVSTVNQADGKFCILIGDDDIFRPGWLKSIKALVSHFDPDIVITDRYVCDKNLNILFSEQCGPIVSAPTLFNCSDADVFLSYLDNTFSTSGFGYISNMIFRHSAWLNSVDSQYVSNHLYPQTIKAMDILHNSGAKLLRVPVESVFARSGNDRLEEMKGRDIDDFEKLFFQLESFLSVANYIFINFPSKKSAFLTPLKRIFSPNFRSLFLSMAAAAHQLHVAENFIFQLDIALERE